MYTDEDILGTYLSWKRPEAKRNMHRFLKREYMITPKPNAGVVWTESEIAFIYDMYTNHHKDLHGLVTYKLANQFGRTLLSINWVRKHLFSGIKDLHRGNAVKRVMKEMNLD